MLKIKEREASGHDFDIPLRCDHYFMASSRMEMLEEARQSPSKLEAWVTLFDRDQRCPNWTPKSRLGDDIRALYPGTYRIGAGDVVHKVKYYLHFKLFGILKDITQRRSTTDIPSALFHPGSDQLTEKNGSRAAIFRQAGLG